MKILITGATGHIGSYLVPRLIRLGHKIVGVARKSEPKYPFSLDEWGKIQWIVADCRAEEQTGKWAERLTAIQCDAVVDLISFNTQQNQFLADAFKGRIKHFLHCGSIWAYGPSNRIPHLEEYPHHPKSQYGKDKTAIEEYLLKLNKDEEFPATIIHPGHISGKYWLPIDPQGSINGLDIYEKLRSGQVVYLPENGMDALHHVHADDVAQVFELAITNPKKSIGQTFSAVSPYGMTLKGCCEAVAKVLGLTANIEFVPTSIFKEKMGEKPFSITQSHLEESVIASPQKAHELLGYTPAYTTEHIYAEFVEHMVITGKLKKL